MGCENGARFASLLPSSRVNDIRTPLPQKIGAEGCFQLTFSDYLAEGRNNGSDPMLRDQCLYAENNPLLPYHV